jgi:hypothetical protein
VGEVAIVEWGPVAAWFGAIATFLAAATALLVAMGAFDRFRSPRLRVTFEKTEPWCRTGQLSDGMKVLWVRVGVENVGRGVAQACVGRLLGVSTSGAARRDIDPVQLRWAGVPRSRAFDPIDLRRDQREFLNVCVRGDGEWRIVTFEDPDFDPGFTTNLASGELHRLHLALFAGNAETTKRTLVVDESGEDASIRLE